MKTKIVFGMAAMMAASLMAADSSPKDDVSSAAKALGDKANYSWKQTMDFGPNSPFQPGPTEGKTAGGVTWLSSTFQDNTSIGIAKDKKVAVKTDEGWKSGDEFPAPGAGGGGGGGGGFDPGAMMARRMQNLRTPSADLEDIISKTKEIKKDSGVYVADLTEDGAKSLLTFGFGGRRGGNQNQPTDAKGSVKIWITDGAITKYETKATGKRERQGETVDVERTTTVEIKDVGTTKIDVPDEAKKKLSS
jgi:hypothetical protein